MIHIVTLVTRPANLVRIAESIVASRGDVPPHRWLALFDASKTGAELSLPEACPPESEAFSIVPTDGWFGEPALRNAALDRIDDGHIVWLDDDNALHPDLLARIGSEAATDSDVALVFDQVNPDGGLRLRAAPENMRYTGVDTAQVVAPRSIYARLRFPNRSEGTDGFMYTTLFIAGRAHFRFINEPLALYNALR